VNADAPPAAPAPESTPVKATPKPKPRPMLPECPGWLSAEQYERLVDLRAGLEGEAS
jgi:hypothetical protein